MGELFALLSAQMGSCGRCGAVCKVATTKNEDARLLRASVKPSGYCVNCAVAEWFWVMGCRDICPDPASLRVPAIQEQFAKIMMSGKADAKPPEIDWEHVIRHWDLPFRVGKRKTVDPVANPQPPSIPRRRRK